MMDALQ